MQLPPNSMSSRQTCRRPSAARFTPLRGEPLEPRMLLAVNPELLSDINAVPAGISVNSRLSGINDISYFAELNGAAFFAGSDVSGTELWRSDGTTAGTFLVKDINPGAASASPEELMRIGNTVF